MYLLSLVGEQPIPVMIPLWQQYTSKGSVREQMYKSINVVQFVGSKNTLHVIENVEKIIRNEFGQEGMEILPPIVVDPYDIHYMRDAIFQVIEQAVGSGMHGVINITGGTKLMSLAALQAVKSIFIDMEGQCDMSLVYVNTEKNQLIYLNSDGIETGNEPIQVQLTIQQYLMVHGLEVSDNQAFNPNGAYNDLNPPKLGDALELKVASLAESSGYFDEVRRNVFIRKTNPSGKPVSNELDVVAISNGRLVVCSCKAGTKLEKEFVYELTALSRREVAGIYCGKVLVLSLDSPPPGIIDRARMDNIQLAYGPDVDRIALIMHLATR